ncbi:beta-lactamase family protein [Microcoleus sp. FACHB-1515]|uniref:serine hydrolase domain-containing protein n=1 Tax=Cyanophyceae TaxID=3028117 RepID=UPI0016875140|nr:serine hydrolase domain-containing protein [Microcoleus sp. FACHB-1515]MBD2093463.1 beta-lactamase family protein [Microcoleus sp. FACHB-1515]
MKNWKKVLIKLTKSVILAVLCMSLVATSYPTSAIAQSNNLIPSQSSPPDPSIDSSQTQAAPGLDDPQELEAFLDAFLPQEMEQEHTLGGVVSVVKDGRLFFVKGYGFIDPEKTIPVDGDRTLFRVASLSKLFTDTAIMQLYERGLLDLNADVNQYLQAFKIQNPFDRPITAANLMTQTDGTTQRLLGIAAPTAAEMTALERFIPDRMPPLIFPPGEIYAYSNMGITLLGYLVQTISETPFVEYVEQNILQPLGMQRSAFQQPVPPELQFALSPGYRYQNQRFNSYPFLYFNIAPAAALSATATDMANFMIAHLQKGKYGSTRILEESTAELMHQQHFTHHPKLPGSAYGFHERFENNLRMIGHVGSMPGYSSSLTLIPEKNIGIFTAFNSLGSVSSNVLTRFFDRYYPAPPVTVPNAIAEVDLKRFEGTYQDLEHPRDTLAKLTAPFGHLHVKAEGNNRLAIETPGLYFPSSITRKKLVPVEPLLLKQIDDDGYTAFGEDASDKVRYLFNPINAKIGAFQKLPWYETIVFQLWFAGICVVLLLSACFISPISKWINRSSNSKAPYKFTRYAHLMAAFAGGLYLFPLIASGLFLWMTGAWKLAYGVPMAVSFLLHLLPIAAILSLGLLISSIFAWKNQYWSWQSRLYYSFVTLAALLFIPFLYYWNLLIAKT